MDGLKSNVKLLVYAHMFFMFLGYGLLLLLSDSPLLLVGTVLFALISASFVLFSLRCLTKKVQAEVGQLKKCLADLKFSVELLNKEVSESLEQRTVSRPRGLDEIAEQMKELVIVCLNHSERPGQAGIISVAKELGKLCVQLRSHSKDETSCAQSEKLLLISENLTGHLNRLASSLDAPVPVAEPPLKANSLRKAVRVS